MHIRDLPPTARRQRGACPDSSVPTWRGLSGRAPSWCRERTRAPSWRGLLGRALSWRGLLGRAAPRRRPKNPAPTWRHFSGSTPPWCSQRARVPPWRSVRGTAPSWHCPDNPMPPWRQFSGRAPSWCRQRTRAPPRRCPDSPAPMWRQISDVAPPWCSQRTRAPSWRNLQGRAPPWRCPNGLRVPAWPWCVLQANTRGTMAGSAPGAPPPSVTSRAEVTSHPRYSPPHVPSANVAVSLGHHRGATFSVTCRLGARIVGLVVWARPLRPGVLGDLHGGAPPWCYGSDARPALTEPGGTQATGGARDRVA